MATEPTEPTEPTLDVAGGRIEYAKWTSAEDVILILGREESAKPLTFREISCGLSRTPAACLTRYNRLCWQGLQVSPDVLETLNRLWIQYRECMFFHYAGTCGVTVDQFERVALCAHLNKPQSAEDEKLDVKRISHLYRNSRREIWRVLSSQTTVPWIVAERTWENGQFLREF